MKKFFTISLAFLIVAVSTASIPVNTMPKTPKVYASEVFISIGKTGTTISLMELSKISKSDLEIITGKKMNFQERQAFYKAQKKLKKGINNDGVITNKKILKIFDGGDMDGQKGFHLGGFALGFFLFLIGVLIAYLIDDEKKKNRTKWAWIGAATALLFGVFLFGPFN